MSKCSCGRSPTGLCIGWHSLTEEKYKEKKRSMTRWMKKKRKRILFTPEQLMDMENK
tara:strand:- start:331 stop:501 length:171 start_codon:yes stop_codon:yes gene_type:complete